MIWKTPTSRVGCAPGDELELDVGDRTESLVRAGVSLHGWIYRSRERPRCYRLIPLDDMPMQRKHELQEWVGTRAGAVSISRAWQPAAGLPYYVVEHGVEAFDRTLEEALGDPGHRRRLASATSVLHALEDWWTTFGPPLLPLPADVVLTTDGEASLLPLPSWRLPDVESLLAAPERLSYLAPEVVRSQGLPVREDTESNRAVDRFAVGAGLLRCFRSTGEPLPDEVLLRRAAGGTLAGRAMDGSRLPAWAGHLDSTRDAVAALNAWASPHVDERQTVSVASLADLFSLCWDRLEPAAAIRQVRADGTAEDAFDLATRVLFECETPEILTLAGGLALEAGRPLEALDQYERAIGGTPDGDGPTEAAEAQLRIILSARREPGPVQDLFMLKGAVGSQLDGKLWRDFRLLSPSRQEELELDMARHLLWRGQEMATSYVSAARFVAQRLGVGTDAYRWWKLDLNVAYAEALLGQGALAAARSQLATAKGILGRIRRSMPDHEVRHWGRTLGDLEAALVQRESTSPSGGSP